MLTGQFVRYKDWSIWVWDSMLDFFTPTHYEAAKAIYKSKWLRENKISA